MKTFIVTTMETVIVERSKTFHAANADEARLKAEAEDWRTWNESSTVPGDTEITDITEVPTSATPPTTSAKPFKLIARKNGSSLSRRQRRFATREDVGRAFSRWHAEGFNTWWLFEDPGKVQQWVTDNGDSGTPDFNDIMAKLDVIDKLQAKLP